VVAFRYHVSLDEWSTHVTAPADTEALVYGTLLSATVDRIVLAIPHTDYKLHLSPGVPVSAFSSLIGKRVTGTVQGEALRIHATSATAGGGRFIEPVIGPPRIVAGRIKSLDQASNQLVVDVAVPFVLSPLPEQDWSILEVGRMVNCYIKSGAMFTPVIS
jgi:hypothetical protein